MAKLRTSDIFGSTEMDLSDGPQWKVTTQEPSSERTRLEREVIEAAKVWNKRKLYYEDLARAVIALESFEAKHE